MRVLIVEDEIKLAQTLKKVLVAEHYVVEAMHDGEEGYLQAIDEDYDVIILDVGLPSMDGFEVCQKLREEGVKTPVLMLTARDTTKDKIEGLDSGADDYLVKPFSIEEMLARIRALVRRKQGIISSVLQVDSLELDSKAKVVKRVGKEISLSSREYALLEYLMHNPNQVLGKQQLLEHVWGGEVDPFSNVIDVYIGYLRKKIDKDFPKEAPLLHTIKGLGYRLGIKT